MRMSTYYLNLVPDETQGGGGGIATQVRAVRGDRVKPDGVEDDADTGGDVSTWNSGDTVRVSKVSRVGPSGLLYNESVTSAHD